MVYPTPPIGSTFGMLKHGLINPTFLMGLTTNLQVMGVGVEDGILS